MAMVVVVGLVCCLVSQLVIGVLRPTSHYCHLKAMMVVAVVVVVFVVRVVIILGVGVEVVIVVSVIFFAVKGVEV